MLQDMPEEAGSTGHNAALQLRSESEAHIHQFIGLNLEDAVALAGRLNLAFRISNSADGWMTMDHRHDRISAELVDGIIKSATVS